MAQLGTLWRTGEPNLNATDLKLRLALLSWPSPTTARLSIRKTNQLGSELGKLFSSLLAS